MATKTLTAANSVLLLSVRGLFDVPQRLQGFATEDIFSVDDVDMAETMMGVDGKMSAGYVPTVKKQTIMLQADSPSADFFDNWYQAMNAAKEVYFATGALSLPALGQKWVMTKGVMTTYNPVPAAKKVLQPRRFVITWEALTPSPI